MEVETRLSITSHTATGEISFCCCCCCYYKNLLKLHQALIKTGEIAKIHHHHVNPFQKARFAWRIDRGLQSPCVCAIPLQLNQSCHLIHSKMHATCKKRKFDKESWLVLPLLSRGNAHIVHPSATAVWIVLGWQQSQKMSSEVVTGFYRRYFVLCKVFFYWKNVHILLPKLLHVDFLALWCAACNVRFNSLPSQKIGSTLAKVSSEAVKPGHWVTALDKFVATPLRKWISYWNHNVHIVPSD